MLHHTNNITPELIENIERVYLDSFKTPSEKSYKYILLLKVYHFIKNKRSTTAQTLKFHMASTFSPEDIDSAVFALTDKNLFNSVKPFVVSSKRPDQADTLSLTFSSSEVFDAWSEKVLNAHPEYRVICS